MAKRPTDNLPLSLLVKLGSIAVHAQELMSPRAHLLDKYAINNLLNDEQVNQWIKDMGPLLPVKR